MVRTALHKMHRNVAIHYNPPSSECAESKHSKQRLSIKMYHNCACSLGPYSHPFHCHFSSSRSLAPLFNAAHSMRQPFPPMNSARLSALDQPRIVTGASVDAEWASLLTNDRLLALPHLNETTHIHFLVLASAVSKFSTDSQPLSLKHRKLSDTVSCFHYSLPKSCCTPLYSCQTF